MSLSKLGEVIATSNLEMYGLRLFIVALQELKCLPNCLHVTIIRVIGFYHFTKFYLYTASSF